MALSPLAGCDASCDLLIDVDQLVKGYYSCIPNPEDLHQAIRFGSGEHVGETLSGTFTEAHVLALTQAICDFRAHMRIAGPLFMGKDTHALSAPAERTALEVLAANGVQTLLDAEDAFTPTPAVSHAIVSYNRGRDSRLADGIILTSSRKSSAHGGLKYNPPHGGPADTQIARWIQQRANLLLRGANKDVRRMSYAMARKAATTRVHDFLNTYVRDLREVVDLDCIRAAELRIGVDPLGGASARYWEAISAMYDLDLLLIDNETDSRFGSLPMDYDGNLRSDCSSASVMRRLIDLKDQFDIAFGNDAGADGQGIVAPSTGLMSPNHYLAAAIHYLLAHRPGWPKDVAVGKTLVTSALVDRIVKAQGCRLSEVPVGFKWFVSGLLDGTYCFGGEESGGATFLRRSGAVWTTDKDGLIMSLLAAEMVARTGKDPGELYQELPKDFGTPWSTQVEVPSTPSQRVAIERLSPGLIRTRELAGEPILSTQTAVLDNRAPIGGLKVVTASGWFAARPSVGLNHYQVYAESFRDQVHLQWIVHDAQALITSATTL
jgi:phosphoglucomutase